MSETNKRTIRRVREEALSNLDLLDGLYTDDYVYHGASFPGDMQGPTAVKEMYKGFLAGMPDAHENVEAQFADGDVVITRFSGRATHTGNLLGVPATGKELRWTALVESRFVGDQIAEEWVYLDSLGFLQQVGLMPKLG